MKFLTNFYLVVLVVLYAFTIKARSIFTDEIASRMSQVTAIGMRIKSLIPLLMIVSLLTGGCVHRQKMREIVSEMRKFDEIVSKIRCNFPGC